MSPSQETLDIIVDALLDACEHTHANAREILARVDRSRLARPTAREKNGADIECGVASALYHALRASSGCSASTSGTVRATSAFGVEREHTARTLAEATLSALDGAFASRHLADVRVCEGESGSISMCTVERYAELRDEGRAMCDKCGRFVIGGERGLWWHRKTKHADAHSEAMEAVERERNALVAISTSMAILSSRNNSNAKVACVDNRAKKAARDDDLKAGVEAARRGDGAVLDALIAANRVKALPLPGLEAARRGDVDRLRAIVSDGWDPGAKSAVDRHGSNALLWAAGGGHLECVKFLVETCEMNPQTAVQSGRRSYAGRNALHWAARNGHLSVVEYLLSRGVDVDGKTEDGSTAFAWACWQGHLNVMRYLVEVGRCDYLYRNEYGCNVACWCAMGSGGVECMEYLASLGVEFDLINANGHSTLHKAAQRGNRDVCAWLLENESLRVVSALARADNEGYDPAGLARVEGFRDVADWLDAHRRALTSSGTARDARTIET